MFKGVYEGENAKYQNKRILILGESHYDKDGYDDFTTKSVIENYHLNPNEKKYNFFHKIAQCFSVNTNDIDKEFECFWNNVYFANYVDELCGIGDSKAKSLIENNKKQINLLEEAAERLYREWFVDLHFPSYENVKIADGVPEGWEREKLSDIFDYVRGKSYTSKEIVNVGGVLMINLKNIKVYGGYNRNAEKRFIGKFKDEQTLNVGDIAREAHNRLLPKLMSGEIKV